MTKFENNSGEREVFVRGSAILRLHQQLAGENETAAKQLQERLAANPDLEQDHDFRCEVVALHAAHTMLERMMQGVSDATITEDLDSFLTEFTDGTNPT